MTRLLSGLLTRTMSTVAPITAVRSMLLLTIVLSSSVAPTPVHADVPEVCRVAFVETGAVPFDDACPLLASTFSPTMANFTCGGQEIDEFCSTLTDWDDCVGDGVCEDSGGGPDDGDDGTDGDGTGSGAGDDRGSDGDGGDAGERGADTSGGSGEAQGLGTDDVEVIEGKDGSGDDTNGLQRYEENAGGGDGAGAGGTCRGEQAIDWNGHFDFVFGPGLDQLRLPDNVPGYGVAGGVVNGYNIASATALARETGDYGPLMDVINGTLLPFGIAGDEFRAFGDFITELSGGTVGCR